MAKLGYSWLFLAGLGLLDAYLATCQVTVNLTIGVMTAYPGFGGLLRKIFDHTEGTLKTNNCTVNTLENERITAGLFSTSKDG